MPLYYYHCQACGSDHRRLLTVPQSSMQRCLKGNCDSILSRTPRPPSSQTVETLDNGMMVRRLERLTDAERLYSERAEAAKKTS